MSSDAPLRTYTSLRIAFGSDLILPLLVAMLPLSLLALTCFFGRPIAAGTVVALLRRQGSEEQLLYSSLEIRAQRRLILRCA